MSVSGTLTDAAIDPMLGRDEEDARERLRAHVSNRTERTRVPKPILPAYDLSMEAAEEHERNQKTSIILIVIFAVAMGVFLFIYFSRSAQMRALRCARSMAETVAQNKAAFLSSFLTSYPLNSDGEVQPKRDEPLFRAMESIENLGEEDTLLMVLNGTNSRLYANSREPVSALDSTTGARPGMEWTAMRDVNGKPVVDSLTAMAGTGGGYVSLHVDMGGVSKETNVSTFYVMPVANSSMYVAVMASSKSP